MPATVYPLRQALNLALQAVLQNTVLPMVNASLTAQFASASIPSGNQFQFTTEQVRIGDVPQPAEPVICIVGTMRRTQMIANNCYNVQLQTQITVKIPTVILNLPESFEAVMNLCDDTFCDVFSWSQFFNLDPNSILTALTPPMNAPLPAGTKFTACFISGTTIMPPERGADGVTVARKFMAVHTANISITANRPTS